MDGGDHAGGDIVAVQHGAVGLEHGVPGEARQLAQQPAVEAEEQAQSLGDGEDKLAMPNRLTDLARDVLGGQ